MGMSNEQQKNTARCTCLGIFLAGCTHSSKLALERAREHVGEYLDRNRQQQLAERDNHERDERDQAQQICRRTFELESKGYNTRKEKKKKKKKEKKKHAINQYQSLRIRD